MMNLENFANIYIDKAIELGNMVKESEESMNLADARAAFENDAQAKAAMDEYTQFQQNMQVAIQSGFMSEEEYAEAFKKLVELEIEVKSNAVTQQMLKAESDYNNFVNSIIQMLEMTIKGEDYAPSGGCGPSCSCNRL